MLSITTKQEYEVFKKYIEGCFPINKVKSDLADYLNEMYQMDRSIGESLVEVYNRDTMETENQVISVRDDVNIISYKARYVYHTDLYYSVIIAIGDYIPDSHFIALFTVNKCLAELKYNADLTLYDVEFYSTEFNKPVK